MLEEIKSWFNVLNTDSDIYLKSELIESMSDLDCFLSKIDDNCIFRGISKEEHIYPSIIRAFAKKNNISVSKVESHNDVSSLERELLKDLVNNGSTYIKDFSALGLLTTAQHFGLPTRCLDWTYNLYIALYFALNNEIQSKRYVSVMSCSIKDNIFWDDIPFQLEKFDDLKVIDHSPDKNIGKRFESYKKVFHIGNKYDEFRRDYITNMYKSKSFNQEKDTEKINLLTRNDIKKIMNNKLLFFIPNFNNERISVQQGIFQIPTKLDAKVIRSQLKKNVTFLIFDLESIGQTNFTKRMKQVGINGYKIMPDLENVCKNIRTKRIEGKYIG